jgi:hypothetical protein
MRLHTALGATDDAGQLELRFVQLFVLGSRMYDEEGYLAGMQVEVEVEVEVADLGKE